MSFELARSMSTSVWQVRTQRDSSLWGESNSCVNYTRFPSLE
jgi:hypothetical protein